MSKCLVCRRPLTGPESVKRSIGPVCYGRQLSDAESNDGFAILPMNDEMDVECRRDPGNQLKASKALFNILQVLVLHSPTGMEWGYGGSGPADFALNILYRFTSDREFSERWHQEFKFQFVATLPREGGVIKGDDVRAFIKEKYRLEESQKGIGLPL